jgi:Flp pilus assembly protein TadG
MTSRRREEGTSAVELVLYMPLLMIAIIFTVQFALVFLGNQAASASAREAARVGRVTDDPALARAKGESYAANLGQGVLEQVTVTVERVGDEEIRATVSGEAPHLLPFFAPPRVSEEVQGPIERFVQDGP